MYRYLSPLVELVPSTWALLELLRVLEQLLLLQVPPVTPQALLDLLRLLDVLQLLDVLGLLLVAHVGKEGGLDHGRWPSELCGRCYRRGEV